MSTHRKTLIGALLAPFLSLIGCGPSGTPTKQSAPQPTVVEEIAVSGFDPEGEPVIRKMSDGSVSIHFEAMPPFFAEDEGTEAEFENFEAKMQKALGVPVRRDDRELFVIPDPKSDTAAKAKTWLETYPKKAGKTAKSNTG
jgi:hypothetical protein